jgi:restriction system protein
MRTSAQSPAKDSLVTAGWMKAVALVFAIIAFFYLGGRPAERQTIVLMAQLAAVALVGYRVFVWIVYPYTGAAKTWAAGERDRYLARIYAQRDRLLGLSPRQFEEAVAQLLHARFGWATRCTPYTADGGWDVEADTPDGKLLVECKQFEPSKSVGRPVIQKLHSAVITEHAAGGVLVTTASFSAPAQDMAEEARVKLIDGEALSRLMREAYGSAQEADVTYSLCRRCGAQVEFPAGHHVTFKKCPQGHSVRNDMTDLFRRAELRAQIHKQRRKLRHAARHPLS